MPLLLMWVLVGCVPARDVPPQLSATSAAAYQVTGDTLITDLYTVTPPDGWRIIAGSADAPYTFQFISPDDTALVIISDRVLTADTLPMPAGLGVSREAATVTVQTVTTPVKGTTLYAGSVADLDGAPVLAGILAQMLDSLR